MLATNKNERNIIKTLQMLRCIALGGVVLSHTGFEHFRCIGHWGVSVFLVMSGFLFTYNYYQKGKIRSVSIKDNILFAINKIKVLYPLHIILMIFFGALLLFGDETESILVILVKILLNSILIQEWFPIAGASLNIVAWYLCTYFFVCSIFPLINNYMEKGYSKRKALIGIMSSLIVQFLIGLLGSKLQPFGNGIWNWIIYYYPLSRLWEFLIGCNLAYCFIDKEHNLDDWKYTILEIISLIIVVLTNIISYNSSYKYVFWNEVFIYSFSTIILVYVFAIGKGKISNLLTNKITLYIAKISPYAFLIHAGVFKLLDILSFHFTNENGELIFLEYNKWIKVLFGIAITIILCEAWIKIIKFLEIKKSNNVSLR